MNSRQLVKNALNHKNTPCIPIDFGGMGVTGIHVSRVAALRDHYGLEKGFVKVVEPYQMLGLIEDDLKAAIGVDTQALDIGTTMFGFRNKNWKEWKTPWGQIVLVAGNFNTKTENNGDICIYPQGDITAPPSGLMAKSSYFFDGIIRQETIVEENLNPDNNTEEFRTLTDIDLSRWQKVIKEAQNSTRALVANIGGMGFGDIALVPELTNIVYQYTTKARRTIALIKELIHY